MTSIDVTDVDNTDDVPISSRWPTMSMTHHVADLWCRWPTMLMTSTSLTMLQCRIIWPMSVDHIADDVERYDRCRRNITRFPTIRPTLCYIGWYVRILFEIDWVIVIFSRCRVQDGQKFTISVDAKRHSPKKWWNHHVFSKQSWPHNLRIYP